jgi:hypothetical protein
MGSGMEADWEFEVGGEAPVIDAAWTGFVDLRLEPERADELAETAEFPALAGVLAKLNGPGSALWTSKCDVWQVHDRAQWDADELDASTGCATHAMACYIDLLPRSDRQWRLKDKVADACSGFCDRMHAVPLRCCRADLVIRRAIIEAHQDAAQRMDSDGRDLGITGYFMGCGSSAAQAGVALKGALDAFAGVILAAPAPAGDTSKLQWESTGE